jgi:hypothetical protein
MGTPYVQFGNVKWTAGWSLDYQGGREPGVCTIRTVPHLQYLEQHGNLTIGEEGNGSLTIRDCLLLSPTFNADRTWDLPILDRRWKWAYGEIDGVYNVKRPDKTFIRERTPQELAELLLIAMGERRGNWDIGRLPNYARPEVDWTNQNPASMFDELVTSLGCTWTLDYFQDRVVVWPVGQGLDLPEAPTESRQYGISAIAKPDEIVVKGARTLFQARFECEAVGKDTDHKIKKLADVTAYNVTEHDDPGDWNNIEDEETYDDHGETKKVRDLAKEWAYRAYRVIGIAGTGGWSPQLLQFSAITPQSFFDLEFIDTRAEQEIDENDVGPDGKSTGRKVNKPAKVVARWLNTDESIETSTDGDLNDYSGHFTFEPRLGLVRFSDPIYLSKEQTASLDPTHEAAKVYIDVAFYAGSDGVFSRPTVRIPTGEQNGTGPRIIVKEDIESRVIEYFSRTTPTQTDQLPDNVAGQLQFYGEAVLAEYTQQPTHTRIYHGLLPIVPDGRTRQVTWAGGDGKGPSTQVSVNTEHNPYLPTIDDSRRKQVIEKLLEVPAWQRTPNDRRLLTAQFG